MPSFLFAVQLSGRLRDPRHWGALGLLCDEAGFLVDAKARAMLARLPQDAGNRDEAGMIKAESIVRSLGVTDGHAFDALLDALSADSPIEMRGKGPGSRAVGGDKGEGRLAGGPAVLVHPDEAIRRLAAFVEMESSAPNRTGMAGGQSHVAGMARRAAEREREFWTRMSGVISDKGTRVWGALERQLEAHLSLLQDRSSSLREVESLQAQNNELRTLLNQYLSSRINDELQIPPTQII